MTEPARMALRALACALAAGTAVAWHRRRGCGGQAVRGRHRQHGHLHRPADRRAAAAPRAGLREADRGQGAGDHGPVLRPLQQAADRFRHRHQQLRCRRVRAAVDGRLHRARLPRGADRAGQGRRGPQMGRHRAVLSRLQRQLQGRRLHHPARWRLPDGLLPHRPPEGGGPGAAQDLGRLSGDRGRVQRQGPERRRQGRLRLVHREEAQRAELLVHHLGRRQLHPEPGHRPGRLLRCRDDDAADRQ